MKLILSLFLILILVSCGKSPLLSRAEKVSSNSQSLEVKQYFRTTSQDIFVNWLTNQNTSEEAKAIVILSQNGTNSDHLDYSLNAYIWMKSMGHGSSPITITKIAPGIYKLEEIYFSMPGDWQLHLTLNRNNTTVEDIEIEYNLSE